MCTSEKLCNKFPIIWIHVSEQDITVTAIRVGVMP